MPKGVNTIIDAYAKSIQPIEHSISAFGENKEWCLTSISGLEIM